MTASTTRRSTLWRRVFCAFFSFFLICPVHGFAAVVVRRARGYVSPLSRVLPYQGSEFNPQLLSLSLPEFPSSNITLHVPSGAQPVLEIDAAVSLPASAIVPRAQKADSPRPASGAGNYSPHVFEQLSHAPALGRKNLSSELGKFWDVRGDAGTAGAVPGWFPSAPSQHAAALDNALAVAWRTKSGKRVLTQVGEALGESKLPIDVLDLGRNLGEYDYLDHRLRINSRLLAAGRTDDLAATLVHELRHVVQHQTGLPAYVLELEIEAHLGDLEFLRELGRQPHAGTFAKQSLDFLREGPERFAFLIQNAVPGSPYLGESSIREVREQLEEDLEYARSKKSKRYAKLAARIEKDLERLSSPEGAAAYRRFSKRVRALLRRRAAAERKRMAGRFDVHTVLATRFFSHGNSPLYAINALPRNPPSPDS